MMSTEQLHPELMTIGELFEDADYTVPLYQRNFAWRAEQIEQLIGDIHDTLVDGEDGYFLGNLIVTQRQSPNRDFEVIDGQQRLTTLYLLLTFLASVDGIDYAAHRDRLRYESRARASEALRRVAVEGSLHTPSVADMTHNEDAGIHEGYNVIRQFIRQHRDLRDTARCREFAQFLRSRVTLVRATLPRKTDLNRYFEIMNTRGQQLQQVDIVKARLMSHLPDEERACFAWIWDATAAMDSYVQMSLTRGDVALRSTLFGDNWSWLSATSFGQLLRARGSSGFASEHAGESDGSLSLDAALVKYSATGAESADEDPDSARFRSTVEFPTLLLHVLKVQERDATEHEGNLDDKRLIRHFEEKLARLDTAEQRADWVRTFAFDLLRSRNLFDGFVLKRQFTATNGEDGDWSLQRLIKRSSKGRPTPGYVHTFHSGSADLEEDGAPDAVSDDVLLLQSMLRVTYTAPKTMHWMTKTLALLADSEAAKVSGPQLSAVLRTHAREKVHEAFFAPDEEPEGFKISRIVFTYLDYLLATQRRTPEFRFVFRNSIEHFYPQRPDEQQPGSEVSARCLNLLGNLALVSVGANSKFSNSLPMAKATNYRTTIEQQSPKLHLMAQTTRQSQGWSDARVRAHHEQMVGLLQRDLIAMTGSTA